MHTFAQICLHICINSLISGARSVLSNNVYYTPDEAFIKCLLNEWNIFRTLYVITQTGDPSPSMAPWDKGHQSEYTANVRWWWLSSHFSARNTCLLFECWDEVGVYTSLCTQAADTITRSSSPSLASAPTAPCPSFRMQTSARIIKALLYSANPGLTLWPFPPLDLNDLSRRAERPEY